MGRKKKKEGASLQTDVGTTTRWGHRIVIAVAGQESWSIQIAVVGCAFLVGLMFKQLSELQGMPVRAVCLELPTDSVALLRAMRHCRCRCARTGCHF